MHVVGFTFIRNAIIYDYPIVESIQSLLPLCEEVVVAVGQSTDETLAMIQAIDSPKIKVITTVWDDSLREGGRVLAAETDKAFGAIAKTADWCIYLQGDEVFHEQDYAPIRQGMQTYLSDKTVEGLLFKYRHFYGSYDYLADSRSWYRREVRIVRKDDRIHSYKDAQGFRKEGQKLKVKLLDAHVHHYGWVKHPKHQQDKQRTFNKLWHDDKWMATQIPDVDTFDYTGIDTLTRFEGTHPKVMQQRIAKMNWQFSFDPTQQKLSFKERVSRKLESWTGYRIGEYKNYTLL